MAELCLNMITGGRAKFGKSAVLGNMKPTRLLACECGKRRPGLSYKTDYKSLVMELKKDSYI